MQRGFAVVFSVVIGLAVVSPVFRDPPRDSFPLSSYPMFSHRLEPVNNVNTVIGREADGTRALLSPRQISGSDEVMLAASDVNRALGGGSATAAALCMDVADRVARSGAGEVVRIEVVTERYDAIAYFGGDTEPTKSTVHASCEVGAP